MRVLLSIFVVFLIPLMAAKGADMIATGYEGTCPESSRGVFTVRDNTIQVNKDETFSFIAYHNSGSSPWSGMFKGNLRESKAVLWNRHSEAFLALVSFSSEQIEGGWRIIMQFNTNSPLARYVGGGCDVSFRLHYLPPTD